MKKVSLKKIRITKLTSIEQQKINGGGRTDTISNQPPCTISAIEKDCGSFFGCNDDQIVDVGV